MDFDRNFFVFFFDLIHDSAFIEDCVESEADSVIGDDSSEVVGVTHGRPHLATE